SILPECPNDDSEIDSTRKRRLSLVAHGTENRVNPMRRRPLPLGEGWGEDLASQLHLATSSSFLRFAHSPLPSPKGRGNKLERICLALVQGQCDHSAHKTAEPRTRVGGNPMTSLTRLLCHALIATTAIVFQSFGANAQSSDAKIKANGSISGRVTISGKAADGIPVAAVAGETVNRRDTAARSVTDSEGHYPLSGLAPGPYQIWTLSPGLIVEPGPFPRYGFPYYGSIQNILLGANEDVSDIDLKLVRGAVITGRVTDAENKPVVEERVSLQSVDENGDRKST